MPEDEVQPKRGRPFRRVENGFEEMPERENGRRCGECPKWERSFCPIRAERRARLAMCCRYGYVLISAMRQENRRQGRGLTGGLNMEASGMSPGKQQEET